MVKKIGWAYEREFLTKLVSPKSKGEKYLHDPYNNGWGSASWFKKIIVGRKEKRLQNESFCSRLSLRPSTQILKSTN